MRTRVAADHWAVAATVTQTAGSYALADVTSGFILSHPTPIGSGSGQTQGFTTTATPPSEPLATGITPPDAHKPLAKAKPKNSLHTFQSA